MLKVELIYSDDCPNVVQARAELVRAFFETKMHPHWEEWQVEDARCPPELRAYGSPTVLVARRDVAPAAESTQRSCRLYFAPDGTRIPVPHSAVIAAALRGHAAVQERKSALRRGLSMVPAVGVALLPKVACPACWPAYAGVLSAIGLGVLINETYLLAATVVFLAIAIFALGFRARARRGFGPLAMGLGAAAILLVGKFHFESDAAMYVALGALLGASLWNTWPRPSARAACPACVEPQT